MPDAKFINLILSMPFQTFKGHLDRGKMLLDESEFNGNIVLSALSGDPLPIVWIHRNDRKEPFRIVQGKDIIHSLNSFMENMNPLPKGLFFKDFDFKDKMKLMDYYIHVRRIDIPLSQEKLRGMIKRGTFY